MTDNANYPEIDWPEAANVLDSRSYHILYACMAGRSLTDVAEDFGLTRERVRQIEAAALRKLRNG